MILNPGRTSTHLSRPVGEKMLENGVAPSYYLEGLLYNVPIEQFVTSYSDTFVNSINWLLEADKSEFLC